MRSKSLVRLVLLPFVSDASCNNTSPDAMTSEIVFVCFYFSEGTLSFHFIRPTSHQSPGVRPSVRPSQYMSVGMFLTLNELE